MNKFLLSVLFLLPVQSFALVDMKNANYSNTWTDLEVPGVGYDFKVARTYNSRSLFNGMFGFGWCSDFETKLEVTPEGFLRIKECGGGVSITYAPQEINRSDIEKTVNTVITKMKAEGKVGRTDTFYTSLKVELIENVEKRMEYAAQYGISVPIKEGTKFFANGTEVEHFVFQKTHYTRNMPDGTSQRFDLKGRLIAQYDKNGNFLKYEYDKDVIKEISDNNSRRLSFKYFPNKKVQKITGPGGLAADYAFKDLENLSEVRNAWLNVYTYEYDDLHNLTKATWPDKTSIVIGYDRKNDWVTTFTDRDKCKETYGYESSKTDPKNHYWSTVKKVCGKETVAENKYEFWHKQRPDGQNYLHRVLTTIAGSTTDIIYHELFSKPVSIRKDSERVTFDYYDDGQVKTKADAASKTDFKYDPQIKKVNEVTVVYFGEKGEALNKRVTKFAYDPKGNLNFASNTDGQKITMTYDNKGRISSITDQAKKVVKIEYEERFGKPHIVTRPGLGAIKVTYKPNGEIQNVESKEGPSVAMQVASTFNNLLDIIAPATQELFL